MCGVFGFVARGNGPNLDALKRYVRAVKQREYPAPEHCF